MKTSTKLVVGVVAVGAAFVVYKKFGTRIKAATAGVITGTTSTKPIGATTLTEAKMKAYGL